MEVSPLRTYLSKYKILILILLLAWYGLFLIQQMDLSTLDLGRHLKNGELFLRGDYGFLTTNYYSYTEPDFPTITHHWGTGVIFYLISTFSGITGVHLFFIALSFLTFLIFFYLAKKESSFGVASLLSFLIIPLIAERIEVRPEVFSYFLSGIFFLLLWKYRAGQINFKWLFALPILGALWINLHILFIFGLFLIGAFLLESLLIPDQRKHATKLATIFLATTLASFLNPFGLFGFIAPFNIFTNYGYRVLENQSVFFLDNLGFITNPNLLLIKVVLLITALSFIFTWIKNRQNFSILYFILAVVFGTMGWLYLRNFTILGLFSLPIIAVNIKNYISGAGKFVLLSVLIFFFSLINTGHRLEYYINNFGVGLSRDNNNSANFFNKEAIRGPIFNNYDIGGYLIYNLPSEKVFVDNRPESYPASFFEQAYVPMQENNDVWKKMDDKHQFNAIFFSLRDQTPWGQKFLVTRIDDTAWAPVYVDQYAIIFLKKNEQNKSIIQHYQVPRNYFSVIEQ